MKETVDINTLVIHRNDDRKLMRQVDLPRQWGRRTSSDSLDEHLRKQYLIYRSIYIPNMQDCWSFTCCFPWTLGSSLKCGLLKSFLIYFGRCYSELAQLVPLPFSQGRSTRYSDRLHDFSVTILRCYKDVYVNTFFPGTARLPNSLPIECFPLTYDLSLELTDIF